MERRTTHGELETALATIEGQEVLTNELRHTNEILRGELSNRDEEISIMRSRCKDIIDQSEAYKRSMMQAVEKRHVWEERFWHVVKIAGYGNIDLAECYGIDQDDQTSIYNQWLDAIDKDMNKR